MTVLDEPPRHRRDRRHDGNGVDLHYLEEACRALLPAIRVSRTVSVRTTDHRVRTLAGDVLSELDRQHEAIVTCLLAWGMPEAVAPHQAVEALPGLHGSALDLAFVDQLTAHAHASIVAARIEMVSGASHRARDIAQDTICVQYRLLAALDVLPARCRAATVRGPRWSPTTSEENR